MPQALVPAVMKLTGDVAPVWFLALHLPAGRLYRAARATRPSAAAQR